MVGRFYCLMAFSHGVAGTLRGADKAFVPMLVMMTCWCGVRVAYVQIVAAFTDKIEYIFFCYPITWGISAIVYLIYFTRGNWVYGFEGKT